MAINSLKDLVIGEKYICFWGSDHFWEVIFLGAINEFECKNTELLIAEIKKNKWIHINMPYASEIGIGESKKEAKSNYCKFVFENLPNEYKNRKQAHETNFHLLEKY